MDIDKLYRNMGIFHCLAVHHVVFRISDRIRIGSAENPDPTRPDPNPKNIISRSSDPILAIFFLLDRARRPRHNKKKIAKIGSVDREIIAKNDFSTLDQSWLRRITDRSVRNTSRKSLHRYCLGDLIPNISEKHLFQTL